MQHAYSPLQRARRTLIGDRSFYKMLLMIVVPIIIQNAITNFVSLLDNIMVGRIGTDQMTGVSIINQLIFVSNLCIFGGVSGAGIFAAQYHGAGNDNGVRHCFRFKMYLCTALTVITLLVLVFAGTPLAMLFLNDSNDPARVASTLRYGQQYLQIMLWGLLPFALSQAYGSTLRETGETALPMRAGIIAVFVNLALNYILIYGKLGFPALGVRGAAIATVVSRFTELAIIVFCGHTNQNKYRFLRGAYHSLCVPLPLVKQICIKGLPLLINEALWSLGVSTITRCYSLRGLDVVTALNITSTVSNLFSVVFLAMGNAAAIIIGQVLGSGNGKLAKDYVWKLLFFAVVCSVVTALILCGCAPFIPLIYNTESSIQALATRLLIACACSMPLLSFMHCCYFTLRSGGKTVITFLFDCAYTWVVTLALAYTLVTFTEMNIVAVYFCVQMSDILKCILGFILVKKGIWIHNMVAE